MIDQQGLGDQSLRLRRQCNKECQMLLFSATYSDKVKDYAKKVVPEPRVELMLKREEVKVKKIHQYFVKCDNDEAKFSVLSDIYGFISVGQSIIFVNTRQAADTLNSRLMKEGHQVSLLHGGLERTSDRDKVTDEFRKGTTRVLITTNVLARGIDIPAVTLVINYDLPVDQRQNPEFETYVHRIGRSGRFGKEGLAINLVKPGRDLNHLKEIGEHFKMEINELDQDKIPEISNMLKKMDTAAVKKEVKE